MGNKVMGKKEQIERAGEKSWEAVFFDLDGTLLPMDINVFLKHYFRLLTPRLASLLPSEKVYEAIMGATSCMIMDNNPLRTNEEVFWKDFYRRTGLTREATEPVFTDFYNEDFPKLKEIAAPSTVSRGVLDKVFNKGLEVVIATNPIFPRQAIEERLRWADIDHYPFALVTSLENMHYCKPHPGYYEEILELLGYSGGHCLMVGNDVDEDLVAGDLGIKTFLVTDHLIDRQKNKRKPDFSGSLKDLKDFF